MGFAENLYRLRKAKGLTQQKLADELKITRSTLASYEQGKAYPHHKNLQNFADYFHVDMNELISGGSSPALTPDEQTHLTKYRLLDTDNQQAIDKQINYLLYEQEEEYKKDGAAPSAS